MYDASKRDQTQFSLEEHMTEALAHEPFEMPDGPIGGPGAWRGADIQDSSDWIEVLTDEEIADVDAAILAHLEAGREMHEITPQTFQLPTLSRRLNEIQEHVLRGRGFVLIRGFPAEKYDIEGAAIGYLGIGSYFGSFRSSNARGHLLGHVRDIGKDIKDQTTRYYQTNKELEFHTDSVDIVGLLCLNAAKEGGASKIVSSVTLHDEILHRRPDLWAALFNAYPTDRRGEIPPGMKPWFDVPVFNWYGGELTTMYVGQYIRSAQENFPAARRLTDIEHEAIDYLDTLCNDPTLNLTMDFRPGDIQLLHNHQILHSRTDFVDWPEPEKRRHLLRLWLAPESGRSLPPIFAPRYGALTPGDRGGIITAHTKLTFSLQAD